MVMKSKGMVLAFGAGLGVICLAAAVVVMYIFTPGQRIYAEVTPIITVIPAPSLEPSPTYAPSLEPTPTLAADVPPDPGASIQVGMSVRITGTEGQGLRLRQDAGKNATPLFLGADNEVFTVKEGPKSADGYTWWLLEAPYDASRTGWAVSNYLAPVE